MSNYDLAKTLDKKFKEEVTMGLLNEPSLSFMDFDCCDYFTQKVHSKDMVFTMARFEKIKLYNKP
jgi:hypothetical protein